MAEEARQSIFIGVDLHSKTNNVLHHTSEISLDRLIVRRGQPFKLTINLRQAFNENHHPLVISAMTEKHATEHQGTLSFFSIPDIVIRSPKAKAVWKAELHRDASPWTGAVVLNITPPADAPIGEFILGGKHREDETLLAKLVVLYNPWCPDDWVYMKDEKEINEYVMNEQGVIFRGSHNYIMPLDWDFGQFEDNMVDICLKVLDLNHKNISDPGDDVSARCNPIYVSRVVSAMINCQDDKGVVEGRWSGLYFSGFSPSHWSGSHAILKRWFNNNFRQVKYGQCWVFAGVMCSVMRLLGIPCRVISNFKSAHDNNMNLTIDIFHADYGVREKPTRDSIWNYHVWVEAWMRRPDLSADGKYDGWQVLDPTPQEKSEGVYCCGPAPVKAILNGETAFKYDVPFVYAEVNADCIDWLVKADNSVVKLYSDTKRVGKNISTKAVGSEMRVDLTDKYKHKEGSEKERSVFKYATTRDYSRTGEVAEMEEEEEEEEEEAVEESEENNVNDEEVEEREDTEEEDDTEETAEVDEGGDGTTGSTDVGPPISDPPPPPVTVQFEEVTPPTKGKDVRLKLVLKSKSVTARPLSISISAQAMRYNGRPTMNIQKEVKEVMLEPATALSIPIRVKFSDYHKLMVDSDSMKITVMVTDKEKPNNTYLAEDDVVLLDPPITVEVEGPVRLNRMAKGQVVFMNPTKDETLTKCTLTLSGSGLWRDELECSIPDIKPNHQIRVKFTFIPYKVGKKTLVADLDCSTFRDIKGHCIVNVKPSIL